MLSDRSYMRRDYPRERTSATVWLFAIFLSAYVLELMLLSGWIGEGRGMISALTLTIRSLQVGHWWTLLTHAVVFSPSNPFHFVATALAFVLIGRELEPQVGPKRLFAILIASILAGAVAWSAVHFNQGGTQFGPSAGLFGMFVVLACTYPNQEINFLALFIFPITVRPLLIVYGLLLVDGLGLIVFELAGKAAPLGLTPSAHLGGMLAGWLFFRFFHASGGWDRASVFRWPSWLRSRRRQAAAVPNPTVAASGSSQNIRAEVDRILDKINSDGFGSLTDAEKRLLDDAKDLLSKH